MKMVETSTGEGYKNRVWRKEEKQGLVLVSLTTASCRTFSTADVKHSRRVWSRPWNHNHKRLCAFRGQFKHLFTPHSRTYEKQGYRVIEKGWWEKWVRCGIQRGRGYHWAGNHSRNDKVVELTGWQKVKSGGIKVEMWCGHWQWHQNSHWTRTGSWYSLFFFLKSIIYILIGCVRSSLLHTGFFSSCGEWRLLFVAVRRLLIVVASLVAEHRL